MFLRTGVVARRSNERRENRAQGVTYNRRGGYPESNEGGRTSTPKFVICWAAYHFFEKTAGLIPVLVGRKAALGKFERVLFGPLHDGPGWAAW